MYLFKTKPFIRISSYWLITTLLFSCAQVVSPGGGPKDAAPPKPLSYSPDSAALNFKSKTITITFKEYIQLKDVNSQLIISPPMKQFPEVKVKNKTLIVEFKETLQDNTTYTLNFGNSIRDITEDNFLDDFQYIFSTGPYLDSLSLTGKVQNAFDNKTEKGVLVMLYDELNDSVPYKRLPNYFAKTREDGSFRINNIRKGKYKVIALKDANSNYLYDTPEESIGFVNESVDLQKNDTVNISLFQEPPTKLIVKKASTMGYGHLLFAFNRPVEKIDIRSLYSVYKKEWFLEEYNEKRDTLHLWLTDAGDPDSLIIELSEKDKVIDTLEFYTLIKKEEALNPKKAGRSATRKLALIATSNVTSGQLFDLTKPISISFNHPIKKWTLDSIYFMSDSIRIKLFTNFSRTNRKELRLYNSGYIDTLYKSDPEGTFFSKSYQNLLKEDKKHILFVPPNSFTDIFGLINDTIKIDFRTQKEKYYGTVKMKISIPDNQGYVLQLMNEKEIVLDEKLVRKNTVNLNYTDLSPQKYKLKLIYDANNNGKWDNGNYLQHTQPEKTIYYSGEMNVRSNWDLDLEWKISE